MAETSREDVMRAALQQIADMDPHGKRADDLGRASRAARRALNFRPVNPGDALGRCFDCMWAGKLKCPHTKVPRGVNAKESDRG